MAELLGFKVSHSKLGYYNFLEIEKLYNNYNHTDIIAFRIYKGTTRYN